MSAFLQDYQNASERASALDNAVLHNATAVSSQYADLVSLSALQAFGSIEISVSNGTDGRWDMSDVKIFMKDMGNSRCVYVTGAGNAVSLHACISGESIRLKCYMPLPQCSCTSIRHLEEHFFLLSLISRILLNIHNHMRPRISVSLRRWTQVSN